METKTKNGVGLGSDKKVNVLVVFAIKSFLWPGGEKFPGSCEVSQKYGESGGENDGTHFMDLLKKRKLGRFTRTKNYKNLLGARQGSVG